MREERNIWVVGGDLRQAKLAEVLQEDGHTVTCYGLEQVPDGSELLKGACLEGIHLADCVILPLPAEGEVGWLHTPLSEQRVDMSQLFAHLRPHQLVCGGKISLTLAALAQVYQLQLRDYFAREELAVANAVPTAEGAVQIALEELPITLQGARVLVLGFGRVAKLCANRFARLGAKVTVAARKWEDLAWAEAYGYHGTRIDQLTGWLCGYDLVVNTVPQQILDGSHLADLEPRCLVIDLASKPGGVDMTAAADLGIQVIWALSLPGKVAPVTSGKIIRDTIYHMLSE